jgi:hypothetical protein
LANWRSLTLLECSLANPFGIAGSTETSHTRISSQLVASATEIDSTKSVDVTVDVTVAVTDAQRRSQGSTCATTVLRTVIAVTGFAADSAWLATGAASPIQEA